MRKRKLNSNAIAGLAFCIPFILGTCIFFLYPIVSSFLMSFGNLDNASAGYHITFNGIENYRKAFFVDTEFVPKLIKVIKNSLISLPMILIVSLLIAIVLNKMKTANGVFRVIIMLPFLLGTGKVMQQLLGLGIDTQILSLQNGDIIPREYIEYMGEDIVKAFDSIFGQIVVVCWSSGVQTLLFLAGLQSISEAVYESAKIDGANEYDIFWKITLPMVSPILLLNAVYTVISSFTDSSNVLLDYIRLKTVKFAEYGYSSAMGWTYFGFIILVIGLIYLIIGQYATRSMSSGGKKNAKAYK